MKHNRLGPCAAFEPAHARACDDCVELAETCFKAVKDHTFQQLIAARFKMIEVIRRNALTLWEKCINLLQQSR